MAIRKINTRSPYYLTVKEEYVAPDPIVPEEGDPDPVVPTDPTDPVNPPPTQSTQNLTYECGNTQTLNGFVGTTIFTKDYSYLLADLTSYYAIHGTPSKLTFAYNGTEVTTGYIGSNEYDAQLIAAGIDPSEINTTASTSVTGQIDISKDAESPSNVTLTVHSPLSNAYVQISNNCEIIPATITGDEVYILRIVSKTVSDQSQTTYNEDISLNGSTVLGRPATSFPLAPLDIVSSKNNPISLTILFMNVDDWPGVNYPIVSTSDLIDPETIPNSQNGQTVASLDYLNINSSNTFTMTNSYGNLIKFYDLRWYKGEIDVDTYTVVNVCLVEDFYKNYGFFTTGLPESTAYPIVKNICK